MELTTTTTSNCVAAFSFTKEVSTEKCTQWLETMSENDSFSGCTGLDDLEDGSSLITDGTDSVGGDSTAWLVPKMKDSSHVEWSDKTVLMSSGSDKIPNDVNTFFNHNKNVYNNVKINKSKKVHLGNVTYINGPVFIGGQNNSACENESSIQANFEVTQRFKMVNRVNWLAQPPMEEKIIFKKSAKYVIVCHTATEESNSQPGNILLVRLIQQFQVESRKWSDISYNYLIGCDGNVYEGRGFDAVGAHTFGYNFNSIGIAFIGFFTKKLPPEVALCQLKALIMYGVEIGAICPDYKLLAHSQCSTTESPGATLLGELRSWPHFDDTVSVENPVEEYIAAISGINYSIDDNKGGNNNDTLGLVDLKIQ